MTVPDNDIRSDGDGRPGRVINGLIAALFLFGFYVLSIGPADLLHAKLRTPVVTGTLETIYWPMKLVYDHGPEPIRQVLDWYLGLWHGF